MVVGHKQHLHASRPATRRRPFAMQLNESGSELLLPEGAAPEVGSTCFRAQPQSAIARPRSAPPADKMGANDGGALRSKSVRARPQWDSAMLDLPVQSIRDAGALPQPLRDTGKRPRTTPRHYNGASSTMNVFSSMCTLHRDNVVANTSVLGTRLLLLAFIYLS